MVPDDEGAISVSETDADVIVGVSVTPTVVPEADVDSVVVGVSASASVLPADVVFAGDKVLASKVENDGGVLTSVVVTAWVVVIETDVIKKLNKKLL